MLIQDFMLLIMMVFCFFAVVILRKKNQINGTTRVLYLVPILSCLIHLTFFGFNRFLTGLYISSAIFLLLYLLREKKWLRRITGAIVVLLCIVVLASLLISHPYVSTSTSAAFSKVVEDMQKNYVLSEWKNIDYDTLKEEYLPKIKAAEESGDETAMFIAWYEYSCEFNDGHVACGPSNAETYINACKQLAGNDFGLSLVTLTTGETIAILVDEEGDAYSKGIRAGTIITKWNNREITDIKAEMKVVYPLCGGFPDKENEEAYKSFFIAGMGEETADITFINENGTEEIVKVQTQGNYAGRLNTALELFNQSYTTPGNLFWEIQDNDHGYLAVTEEIWFAKGSITGDFNEVKEIVLNMIHQMKAAGVQDLIIDLRNNGGGDDRMGMAITSKFATEDFFYFADGKKGEKPNEYLFTKQYIMEAEPAWTDIPIAVLVNSKCVSAGDGLAYNLNKLDNVTLMGITGSTCSFQAVGGSAVAGPDYIQIVYPTTLQLDEDGSIMIDTEVSRITTVPRDIKIPVTQDSALKIFDRDTDYECDYAKAYLESLRN